MEYIAFHFFPTMSVGDIDDLCLSDVYSSARSLVLACGNIPQRHKTITKITYGLIRISDDEIEYDVTLLFNLIQDPLKNAKNYLTVNHFPEMSQAGLYFGLK